MFKNNVVLIKIFVEWCSNNCLKLNISKTKELVLEIPALLAILGKEEQATEDVDQIWSDDQSVTASALFFGIVCCDGNIKVGVVNTQSNLFKKANYNYRLTGTGRSGDHDREEDSVLDQ